MTDRASPRYALEAAITLRHRDVATAGRTRNLSRGGLCAHVAGPVANGSQVTVEISLVFDDNNTSESLNVPARVVWSTPLDDGQQVGLSFLALDGEQTRYLDLFLRYLADPGSGRHHAESDHDDLFSTERRDRSRR